MRQWIRMQNLFLIFVDKIKGYYKVMQNIKSIGFLGESIFRKAKNDDS